MRPLLLMEVRDALVRAWEENPTERYEASEKALDGPLKSFRINERFVGWELPMVVHKADGSLSELDVLRLEVKAESGKSRDHKGGWYDELAGRGECLSVVSQLWRAENSSAHVKLLVAVSAAVARSAAAVARSEGRHGAAGRTIRLRKQGSCMAAMREWVALHRLDDMDKDIRTQLLGRQSWQSPRGDIPAVGSQWDKCERHIKQIERTARLDVEQLEALTQTARMVHRKEKGFSLVQVT
ncbi:MAG: hypothetical protein SGPRY_008087 [Prymnesium sp.]